MKFIYLVFLFCLFVACNKPAKLQKAIYTWESINNQQKTANIQVFDSIMPFYYGDSAVILKTEMDSFIIHKKHNLQFQLQEVEKRLTQIQLKIENEPSILMQKAMKTKQNEVLIERNNLNKIIATYNTQAEVTQIGWYQKQIRKYKQCPQKVIGNVVTASFISDNHIKLTKQYLVDTSLQNVITVVQ